MKKIVTVWLIEDGVSWQKIAAVFNLSRAQAFRVLQNGMYIKTRKTNNRPQAYINKIRRGGSVFYGSMNRI